MQKLWKITCDFCGKTIDRQDLPKRKKYRLHNIGIEIHDADTSTQGVSQIGRLDFCNSCALKFVNFLKDNIQQPEQLPEILQSFHDPDPNDNNSFYRYTSEDDYYRSRVFCTVEDYKNEEELWS